MNRFSIFAKSLATFGLRYIFPLFSIGAVTALTLFLSFQLQDSNPYLLFTLLIFLHTWTGGFRSGVFTSFLITIVVLFLFLTEKNLAQTSASDVTQSVIYLIQALVIVFITDLLTTTHRQMQWTNNQLLAGRKRLQEIIDSIFNLVIVVSPSGKIIEANEAISEIATNHNLEIIGEDLANTYPWSYSTVVSTRLKEKIAVAVQSAGQVNYDEVIRFGEDEFADVEISIVPIKEENDVSYLTISLNDITERKRYQRELEQIEANYSKLVNANIVGMMIADEEGNILEANEAYLDIIGYTRQELEQGLIRWDRLLPDEFQEVHRRTISQMIENGYVSPTTKEYLHKEGHRVPVMLSGVLIDNEEMSFMCLVIDISEQKELERKKDEFISIASHELKTPLTSVKGYLQLLDNYLQQGRFTEAAKFTSRINYQLDNLTGLINELLDISRIEAGKIILNKTRFSLDDLIEEVIQEVQPLSHTHNINFKIKPNAHMVNADRFRIAQVITNLLTNAIKYSPEATQIDVTIHNSEAEYKVSVRDYGIGIPETKQREVFTKFYRVEEAAVDFSQGLGLGLYIAAEIVARHNGEIGVESTVGKGSTFYFTLPV